MVLHHYQSSSGKDLIMEYVKSLPDDEKQMDFLYYSVCKMKKWIK